MKKYIRKLTSPSTRQASLLKDDRGLSTVEYVILLVLIAAACVGIWMTFGKTIHGKINAANEEVDQISIDHAAGDDGK